MVHKSIDHKKLLWIFSYNNIGKVRAEMAVIVCWENMRVTSDVTFIVCTLIDNSYMYKPISVREVSQLL